jgi:cell division protein FtsB
VTITAPPPRTRPRVPHRTLQPNQPRRRLQSTPTDATTAGRRSRSADATAAGRRSRSAASQRAYERKAQRQAQLTGQAPVTASPRTPFVLLVMGLLAVGLITSLWLSTAAAADSYRLEQAQLQARELSERSARLRQEVATLQTAPELAKRARALGMVASPEPARLVVQPDGSVVLVGKPVTAAGPPPPALPSASGDRPPAATSQRPAPGLRPDRAATGPVRSGPDRTGPAEAVQAAAPAGGG